VIVALDQALAHTGWAWWREDQVWVGELVTHPEQDRWQRLLLLERMVEKLYHFGAKHLVLEAVYGRHADLIRVQTTLYLAAARLGLSISDINSDPRCRRSWRAALGLPGGKKHTQQWAEKLWGVRLSQHQADALGILFGWCLQTGLDVCPQSLKLVNHKVHDHLDHLF